MSNTAIRARSKSSYDQDRKDQSKTKRATSRMTNLAEKIKKILLQSQAAYNMTETLIEANPRQALD